MSLSLLKVIAIMENYNFKFKKGDIVVITRNSTWPDYAYKPKRICIILGSILCYCRWGKDGQEGEKHPFYILTYDLRNGISNKRIDHDATDETIRLLEEYWYINEDFEICKETDVKFNSKFLHRANSFGVFLTEDEAESSRWKFKCENYLYRLI